MQLQPQQWCIQARLGATTCPNSHQLALTCAEKNLSGDGCHGGLGVKKVLPQKFDHGIALSPVTFEKVTVTFFVTFHLALFPKKTPENLNCDFVTFSGKGAPDHNLNLNPNPLVSSRTDANGNQLQALNNPRPPPLFSVLLRVEPLRHSAVNRGYPRLNAVNRG